jgi:hypothetical protein
LSTRCSLYLCELDVVVVGKFAYEEDGVSIWGVIKLDTFRDGKKPRGVTYYLLILLLAGLTLVFISVLIDHQHNYSKQVNSGSGVDFLLRAPFYTSSYFWSSLSRELGFAVIVALVVTWSLERRAKEKEVQFFQRSIEETNKLHLEKKEEIAKDVLFNTLKRKIPKEISEILFDIIDNDYIVRRKLYLKYNIQELSKEYAKYRDKYICLEITISYSLENTSNKATRADVTLCMPFPSNPELLQTVGVEDVYLAGRALSAEEIAEGDLRIPNTATEKRARWHCDLDAGATVPVSARFRIVKERSDSDCWTSLLPTTDGQYEVVVGIPLLEWSVDALHSGRLTPADGTTVGVRIGGSCVFNLEKGLLPHQGVLLWWRPKHDGRPEVVSATGSSLVR